MPHHYLHQYFFPAPMSIIAELLMDCSRPQRAVPHIYIKHGDTKRFADSDCCHHAAAHAAKPLARVSYLNQSDKQRVFSISGCLLVPVTPSWRATSFWPAARDVAFVSRCCLLRRMPCASSGFGDAAQPCCLEDLPAVDCRSCKCTDEASGPQARSVAVIIRLIDTNRTSY